jgi:urease subunit alpha
MSARISREQYVALYGPTAGDRIQLADTGLTIIVEQDLTTLGDEVTASNSRSAQDGMQQCATALRDEATLDVVITNAVVMDWWGIVKADIGIRDGRIVKVGKAGNPHTMNGVDPQLVVGPGTEIIAAENLVATPGGVALNVRLDSPGVVAGALSSGITTLIGGGGAGSEVAATPGAWRIASDLETVDQWPVNAGIVGQGSSFSAQAVLEQARAGACGVLVHESRGATAATLDAAIRAAEEAGIQVFFQPDRRFPAASHEETVSRTEGRPYVGLLGASFDSLVLAASPGILAAAPVSGVSGLAGLHDAGVIPIVFGRRGFSRLLVAETWRAARSMKAIAGPLPEDPADADNFRVRRYLSKYTKNPALASGIAGHTGAIEPGLLADLVLWKPALFGAKPELVIKGGSVIWTAGLPNSIGGSVHRPFDAPFHVSARRVRSSFSSLPAIEDGLAAAIAARSPVHPVIDCRWRTSAEMVLHPQEFALAVDTTRQEVSLNGTLVPEPSLTEHTLTQRYFLF